MEKIETATDLVTHRAALDDGTEIEVLEKADRFRIWEPFPAAWSEWSPGRSSFHWDNMELTLLEDGNWQTSLRPARLLRRLS